MSNQVKERARLRIKLEAAELEEPSEVSHRGVCAAIIMGTFVLKIEWISGQIVVEIWCARKRC